MRCGAGSALIDGNASFKWDDTTSVPVLSGVNFKACAGELAAVVRKNASFAMPFFTFKTIIYQDRLGTNTSEKLIRRGVFCRSARWALARAR
jgi:hypothetical protein